MSAARKTGGERRLGALRKEAAGCRRCELWERGTQTVFGAGPAPAALMLVGEQPGDQEDRAGLPFVGPAGRVLERALGAVGLTATDVYVTNVVKHFSWEERGKRRIHKKPKGTHVRACRVWLDQEIETVQPAVIVALGSVAAQALLGASARVTRDHGVPMALGARSIVMTIHPSSILRAPDRESRARALQQLIDDLQAAVRLLPARAS